MFLSDLYHLLIKDIPWIKHPKRSWYILKGRMFSVGANPADYYCNACGKVIGPFETPKQFILYKRPPVYLCFSCGLDYEQYERLCRRLGRRKEVFDILLG